MSIQTAVTELQTERARIDRALAALEVDEKKTPARPTAGQRRTFTMSAEAKQKIAAAQKKRWATIKKGMTSKAA